MRRQRADNAPTAIRPQSEIAKQDVRSSACRAEPRRTITASIGGIVMDFPRVRDFANLTSGQTRLGDRIVTAGLNWL
jgi:hypothetical protein